MNPTTIGKVVRSNSHIDYICQVYGPGEVATPPSPTDYAFGTFVRIALEGASSSWLVGVVYNTILMNPEFGNLGPRLSPAPDLQVFSPDYLNEKVILVGILAVGIIGPNGLVRQGVPRVAAQADALVEQLSDEDTRAFHQSNPGVRLNYVPFLLAQQNPLIPHLLLNILDQIEALFPDQTTRLAVLRNNLAWKSLVQPAG